jgi:hypothetical protein
MRGTKDFKSAIDQRPIRMSDCRLGRQVLDHRRALSALGSSKSDVCIYIAAGTYKEQLTISYLGKLTTYGETTDTASYKNNRVTITDTISSPQAGTRGQFSGQKRKADHELSSNRLTKKVRERIDKMTPVEKRIEDAKTADRAAVRRAINKLKKKKSG